MDSNKHLYILQQIPGTRRLDARSAYKENGTERRKDPHVTEQVGWSQVVGKEKVRPTIVGGGGG